MNEKIKILDKKVKIDTNMRVLAVVVPLVFTLLFIGVLWFAEVYADWRKTHEWQFPIVWIGFTREIEPEVISPISGISEKTEKEIMKQYPLRALLETVYFLESTEGRNDGCRNEGKVNGFGYAQSNHTWQCFDSFEEVVSKVNNWFVERLAVNGNDVAEALCYYNTGFANQKTCTYSQNFMSVITKDL